MHADVIAKGRPVYQGKYGAYRIELMRGVD